MLKELATDQLPDLSRADDQRILDVRRLPPCEGPGCRSRRHDEEKSKEPKRCELRLVRVRETDEPRGGVEEPDAYGDEVEDADDLVGGRVRGALLVAVVETVELGRQDPHRQQSQEDDRLDADSDLADELGPVEEGLDDRKSRCQRIPQKSPPLARYYASTLGQDSKSRKWPKGVFDPPVGQAQPEAFSDCSDAGGAEAGPAAVGRVSSSSGRRRASVRCSATSTAFVFSPRISPICRADRSAPYRKAMRSRDRSSSPSTAAATVSR